MPRLPIPAIAGLLVLAACSGADASPATDADVASPSTTGPQADEPTTTAAAPELASAPADEPAADEVWGVEIEVVAEGVDGGDLATTVAWSGDAPSIAEADPFGEFGACSGWRSRLAGYTVLVSGAADVDAVSVWTADRVVGPGTYDAEVRIERPGSAPIEASGTMTILDGLQEGEFVAFVPAGGRIEGTFTCSGTAPPVPLETDADDPDPVEVFVQLRKDDADRVLGLATAGSVDVECSGASGSVIVDVEGDASIGGITAFELAGDGAFTGSLRAGGATYEFDDVTVSLDERGASGVFAAASPDGISVDGAFRCG